MEAQHYVAPVTLYLAAASINHLQRIGYYEPMHVWEYYIPFMLCAAAILTLFVTACVKLICPNMPQAARHEPPLVQSKCVVIESPGQQFMVGMPV